MTLQAYLAAMRLGSPALPIGVNESEASRRSRYQIGVEAHGVESRYCGLLETVRRRAGTTATSMVAAVDPSSASAPAALARPTRHSCLLDTVRRKRACTRALGTTG